MVVVPWGSHLGGQRIPFLHRVVFKAALLKGPHIAERYFIQDMDVLCFSVKELCGTIRRAIGEPNVVSVLVLSSPCFQEHCLSAAPVLIRKQQLLRRNSQQMPRAEGVIWRRASLAQKRYLLQTRGNQGYFIWGLMLWRLEEFKLMTTAEGKDTLVWKNDQRSN